MWLSEDIFKCVVSYAPLVSIDLIVEDIAGKILVGRRKNSPAKGFLFVPGGRIFKNETVAEAFKRISRQELGRESSLGEASFFGVFEHFYDDSIFGKDVSTHYVVLAHKLSLSDNLSLPDTQHSEYLWLTVEELLNREDVHSYTKVYGERLRTR